MKIRSLLVFIVLSLIAAALPAYGVTCCNCSSDLATIQASINAGGVTTINGPCSLTGSLSMTSAGVSLVAGTNAVLNQATNSAQALDLEASNLTVRGITFNGGTINSSNPLTGLTFTNNTVENITATSGGCGWCSNGFHSSTITGNTFSNVWQGGYVDYTATPYATENGPTCWADFQGIDGTVIENNIFTECQNDGFHINPNGSIHSTTASSISYNHASHVHRAAFEIQAFASNLVMKANTAVNFSGPYYDSFAFSIASVGNNFTFINNLGGLGSQLCVGGVADYLEMLLSPGTIQGNASEQPAINPGSGSQTCTLFPSGGSSNLSQDFLAAAGGDGTTNPSNTLTVQNNIACGNPTAVVLGNETSPARNIVDQYNFKTSGLCPMGTGYTSNVSTPTFTSTPHQAFPSGGSGTWTTNEISALPIKWVNWSVDGVQQSQQELSDVSTTFASDRKWDYHTTFNTSAYANGAHTITATAVDVMGATSVASDSFTVGSPAGGTVVCTGSGDAAAIQASLNTGGATVISGHCDIGTTSIFDAMDGTTLTATAGSGASITYHTSGFNQGAYAMYINNSTITVSNITWNGGGFSTTNSSHTTPQHDVTITNNIIQNIVSGTNGIDASGLWLRFNITNNQFLTISSVPVGSITNATNVENGGGGYSCNYPTVNGNQCAGGGINQGNGVDQTTIANNLFDVMLGDGMHLGFNWMLSSNAGDYVTSTNNIIANNTFTRGHRINIEMQGDTGSGCPGGCNYGRGYSSFSGWQIKGNTAYNYIGSYGDTYFLSIPVGTIGMVVINNTGIMNDPTCASECAGYAAEIAGTSGVYQGNAFTRSTASTDWSAYFMVGSNFTATGGGGIVTLQNNYLRASDTSHFYACESTSFPCPGNGTIVNQYNNATTAVVANPLTSTIASAFASTNPIVSCTANGASFPSGGNASWCVQVTNQLAIRNVIFYLDGSTTPYASGIEVQDLNTNFASTGQWLYHITINTSTLANGSHTIKETATDGGQTQSSATQTFTVGSASAPAVTLSPTSQAFGIISVGSTSSNLTTTLTNSGTGPLTISSIGIGGTNTGDFSVASTTCGSTLAVSLSCNILANFHPTATGARSATITIADNATGTPHTVPLTGTGSGGPPPACGTFLQNCDFGTGSLTPWVFNGSAYAGIGVDNTTASCPSAGSYSANVTATSSVPSGQNVETLQKGLTFTPGATYNVSIYASTNHAQHINVVAINQTSFTTYGLAWTPLITGSCAQYTTSFTVVNSTGAADGQFAIQMDALSPTDRISIAEVSITLATGTPAVTFSPTSVAFGSVAVGSASSSTTISLTNSGSGPMTISAIGKTGTNPADFMIGTTTCGSTLAASASCNIPVTFVPSATGARSASITVTDSASGSPHSVPLTGTGTSSGSLTVTVNGVDSVSHSSARIKITSSLAISGNAGFVGRTRAVVSPSACIGNTNGLMQPMEIGPVYSTDSSPGFVLYMDIAGLTANTVYNVCPELSNDGGSTWTSGVGTTFTTLPLPAIHPAFPIAPTTFDPSYPNTTGFFTYMNGSGQPNLLADCSDIGTAYTQAVGRQATQGTVINVLPGTVCGVGTGNFNFALAPPDVNSFNSSAVNLSNSSIQLGNSSGLAPTLAVGQQVRFAFSFVSGSAFPTSQSCEFGDGIQYGQNYFVASIIDSSTNTVTLACNLNGSPGPTMVFTDAGTLSGGQSFLWVPTVRTLKPIIVQSSAINTNQLPPPGSGVSPKWAPNMWILQSQLSNLNVVGPGGAVLVFGGNDGNYQRFIDNIRLVGMELTTVDSPEAHTSTDPLPWSTMIYTDPTNSRITLDRVYVHMQPPPNRDNDGFYWDGYQNAVIDSYFDNILYYHAEYSGLAITKTSGTVLAVAPGIVNTGSGNITVPSQTVTIAGSGTGEIFLGLDMTASNAFTVWTPSGITATCSPTCANKAVTGTPNATCNYSDAWQTDSSGNASVGEIGCFSVASGALGSLIVCPGVTVGTESACPWNSAHWTEGAQWMIGGRGPGPYVFKDNVSICAGLCWHHDDSGGTNQERGDYTYLRNYFLTPFQWMYNPGNLSANPLSIGVGAYHRQPVEWKGGRRINFNGNTCDGNWVEIEASAGCVLLTSVNGMGITDVNIVNNTFMHGPGVTSMPFVTAGSNFAMTPPVLRSNIGNNVAWDIGPSYYYAGRAANAPPGWFGEGPNATEDLRLQNNSVVMNIGTNPAVMWPFDLNTEGISVTNNMFYINGTNQGLAQDGDVPSFSACAGLNGKAMADCKFTPNYVWSNNLMVPNGQSSAAVQAAWPTLANYFQSGTTGFGQVGFYNFAAQTSVYNGNPLNLDYHLLDASPWIAGASTVTDHTQNVGANINALQAAQGILSPVNVPANLITTTGATVQYVTADAAGAFVDICAGSDTNCLTPLQRISDTGGNISRSIAVTGLVTKTYYRGRVLAQGNANQSQQTFSFWTN